MKNWYTAVAIAHTNRHFLLLLLLLLFPVVPVQEILLTISKAASSSDKMGQPSHPASNALIYCTYAAFLYDALGPYSSSSASSMRCH